MQNMRAGRAMKGWLVPKDGLIGGFAARLIFKMNYTTISGLLAGSMTDPPALAFAHAICKSDAPLVAYATVYPLAMLLRILTAQILALIFCG